MESTPNFTPRAQEALKKSRGLAIDYRASQIDVNHLLLGLVSQVRGLLREIFDLSGYDIDYFKEQIEKNMPIGKSKSKDIAFSKDFKAILSLAFESATNLSQSYVGTEHLLIAIIKYNSPKTEEFFRLAGVNQSSLSIGIKSYLMEASQVFTAIDAEKGSSDQNAISAPATQQKTKTALDLYAINYNELASQGKFSKVICRDASIHEMTEILCRKNKNNPILLGEPGIGKTALVEGLALSIVSSNCSEYLMGHTIFGLDLAAMIAGTKYRGQFEERLKNLMNEIKELPKVILFIDEIHTLVGAGAAEGSMDAANILKPMLARGDMRCIGATTINEYKHIEKDGALARRFQSVNIDEPSRDDCKKILRGIVDTYEGFHNVVYDDKALELCVDLSMKYIHDRHLPDKAIDIMDQAGSKVKIAHFKRPKAAREIEAELEHLMREEDECVSIAAKADLSTRQDILFKKYKKIIQKWSDSNNATEFRVTPEDIYFIMSKKLGIPADQISETSEKQFLSLESELNDIIIGQESAISSICKALIRNRAGLKNENKPVGSFLLLGRSGVGKTHTAKIVAEKLFGSKKNFININMSEYSEGFTSSKLIGSAPGYVGYESSGNLTEKVRKHPYSVLLFDEIEKAHHSVIQTLLQILDEGKIQDNKNRTIDFKNCVIFITGNIGSDIAQGKVGVGFAAASQEYTKSEVQDRVRKEALKILSPEFLNRLDDLIIFNSFDEENYGRIVDLHIHELRSRLKEQSINLVVNKTAKNKITEECLKLKDGARPIARVLEECITNPLSEKILEVGRDTFKTIRVSYLKSEFTFKFS
jgi:ATP-dependent Clp protease ATP-binding subunit ClpC|tara:strand:+ start:18921 stop:21374 length:2454 start_codon:yes stop_codon:yes gene_type:complete